MPTPGPGHNSSAFPEAGFALRAAAWRQAKASQKAPSPQVVKMMLARAKELGISYADYASLVGTGGRDIGAFLFTPEGLRLKLGRRLEMPEPVRAKLSQVQACRLLALAPDAERPEDYLEELREVSGLPFTHAAPTPLGDGWSRIRAALHPTFSGLPPQAVALIGAKERDFQLVAAASLAGMVGPEALFGA